MGGARLEGGGAVGEVRLDHTTPLRGTLGRGRGRRDRGSERQSERREEEEDGGSNGGEARGQEARMWARPVWKETVPWETLRGHASSRRKEREWEREGEREETERERHLRRYHEHLQQFLPSAALLKTPRAPEPPADSLGPRGPRQPAPAGEEGASRRPPSPSHALELGHGSRSGPGERVPNAVDTELTRARGEMQETPPFGPATGSDLGLGEGWAVLGAGDEKEESWEGERETERGSDGPALLGWSSEEEDYSAYLSTESSSSNNNNNIPAERPLSPPRTSSALLAEDLNDLSHEFKCSNSQPREGLGPAWAGADPLRLHFDSLPSDSVNIALSASAPAVSTPLTGCSRRASGNPDSGEAPATSFALPGEAPAAVTSSTGAEPQDGTGPVPRGTAGAATPSGSAPPSRGSSPSAAESSTSTMDPLSISLLQVERQAATDSFLRPSSCSPAPLLRETVERGAGEGRLTSYWRLCWTSRPIGVTLNLQWHQMTREGSRVLT
ncbi:hypothetical protein ANANG_G00194900 [Anguilla anguilla]|uniref:Uncharacterized protein n=1 Tax=Anguilla anguilla TaxID=7936 RepID=A0A9D3M3G4_ANGAN|nr:hypothetical protein ANANG_G00194900 [Anguilla anguilla]